jgi:K+-sensing histidine kinase KdpD
VNSLSALELGEARLRHSEVPDGRRFELWHSIERQKGNLRIFYADAAGVDLLSAMLRAAHAAHRCGIDIVVGHLPLDRAPRRRLKRVLDLMAEFESLPLPPPSDRKAGPDFDFAAARRRRPAIIATAKRVSADGERPQADIALDRWYLGSEELLAAGIDVWAAVCCGVRRPRRRHSPTD